MPPFPSAIRAIKLLAAAAAAIASDPQPARLPARQFRCGVGGSKKPQLESTHAAGGAAPRRTGLDLTSLKRATCVQLCLCDLLAYPEIRCEIEDKLDRVWLMRFKRGQRSNKSRADAADV